MKNRKKIAICVLFVFGLIAISSFTDVNSVLTDPDPDPGNSGDPRMQSIPIQPIFVSIDIPMGSLSAGHNLLLNSISTGI